jgi:Fe-S cluster biosynthesis and repair protein YggX
LFKGLVSKEIWQGKKKHQSMLNNDGANSLKIKARRRKEGLFWV